MNSLFTGDQYAVLMIFATCWSISWASKIRKGQEKAFAGGLIATTLITIGIHYFIVTIQVDPDIVNSMMEKSALRDQLENYSNYVVGAFLGLIYSATCEPDGSRNECIGFGLFAIILAITSYWLHVAFDTALFIGAFNWIGSLTLSTGASLAASAYLLPKDQQHAQSR